MIMETTDPTTNPCRCAKRIRELTAIAREKFPNQAPTYQELTASLKALLAAVRLLHCPEITLTPTGGLEVEWRQDWDQFFTVEFLGGHPEQSIYYTVCAPSLENPSRRFLANSFSTVEAMNGEAGPFGVVGWALRKWAGPAGAYIDKHPTCCTDPERLPQ